VKPLGHHRGGEGVEPLIVLAALGLAVLAGLLLSSLGEAGPLVGLAVVGGLVVVRWPFLGLLLLTASLAVENLFVLEGAGGAVRASRLLGMAVFGGWFVGKLLRRESFRRALSSGVTVAALLFFLVALASVLWASYPAPARAGAIQMLQFIALAILVLDMARTWDQVDQLVKALVVGSTVAAALVLHQSLVGGHRRAGGDIAGGINATATLLVTLLPLAFYLLRSPNRWPWKLLGVGYLAMAVPAVMLTYSRMNLLLLPLVLGFLVLDTLKGKRGRGWLISTGIAASIVALFVVPMDRLAQRADTILPYVQSTVVASDELEVLEPSPRGYHIRLGLAVARDNPFLGAGFRNYGYMFRDEYQFLVPGAGRLYRSVRSPHSSHVGILADLGIVGFALWLVLVVGIGLGGAIWAWRSTSARPESRAHLLARGITVAIALQVFAYGWYTNIERSKLLWLLLGLAAAIQFMARPTGPVSKRSESLRPPTHPQVHMQPGPAPHA
jgi:O-antigen ligase